MICAHPENLWITFLHPVFVEISEAEIVLELDLDFDLDLNPRTHPSFLYYPGASFSLLLNNGLLLIAAGNKHLN